MYAPGDSGDKMALAIKEFNEYVIKAKRVEVIALPFRDGVNIVQRRCSSNPGLLQQCAARVNAHVLHKCSMAL